MNYYNRLSSIAVSQLIEAALKLVLGLTFAYFGIRMRMSIPMISALCVLGITVGSMVCCVYLYILFKNMFNGEKAGQNYTENKKTIDRSIFKIAIPISFGAAMLNLGGMIDLGVIMRKLTDSGMSADEANAIYGNYTTLAVPMINLVISIITPIMLAFLPKLAMSYNRGDRKVFLDELKTMTLINSVIAIPAAFGFFFYAFEILDILFSVNSAAVGAELLIYSSIGLIFLSLLTIVNSVLEAQGRIRLTVLSLIIGSFVKVMSNLVLVERNGISGAPLGTVLSYAVSLIISLCAIRSSECRLQIICSAITDSLAAFLSFLMPYYFLFYSGMFSGFLGAFLCISLSVLVYFSFLAIKYLREIKWNEMLKMHKKDDERLDIQTKLSPLDLK
jgi:stage V sporulation protein B